MGRWIRFKSIIRTEQPVAYTGSREKCIFKIPIRSREKSIKEGGPIDDDPYKHLPDENYEHPETFKAL